MIFNDKKIFFGFKLSYFVLDRNDAIDEKEIDFLVVI